MGSRNYTVHVCCRIARHYSQGQLTCFLVVRLRFTDKENLSENSVSGKMSILKLGVLNTVSNASFSTRTAYSRLAVNYSE